MNIHYRNYALTMNPISHSFQSELENIISEPLNYLVLMEMRQRSLWKLWRTFRSIHANNLYLLMEHETLELLLPILKIVSVAIPTKKIIIVHKNLTFTPFKKIRILQSITGLFFQSIRIYFSSLRCRMESSKLLAQHSEQYQINSERCALYIDASIWFGTKAGGSVGHMAGVANGLTTHNYTVDYAAVDRLPLLYSAINFIKINPPNFYSIPPALNICFLNNLISAQLSQRHKQYQFIYQRISIYNYAGVVLSRKLKIPLIMEYNGSTVWLFKNWARKLFFEKLADQCERVCLKHAHAIVTISEVLRDELISSGISPNKIVCYPNCVDPKIFNPDKFTANLMAPLRDKLKIPQHAVVFTFIGTFGAWHGTEVLAKAIRKFIDSYPKHLSQYPLRFLLIGDGVKMSSVKQILNVEPYKGYVIYTGMVPQSETSQYLAISDVCFSPQIPNPDGSRFFGSPTKLFEYMIMRKAIVASNLEQLGQILQNSLKIDNLPYQPPSSSATELGILCEPENIDDLVKAILFLLENPQWRKKLGENARKKALERYTWKKHVAEVLTKITTIT